MMNGLKMFLRGVLKIATALVLAVVALALIGWGIYEFGQRRELARDASLNQLKKWPQLRIEALGNVELTLLTRWQEGKLYYQFSVNGYPRELAAVRDRAAGQSAAAWTLTLLDEHGFNIFEHNVTLHSMAEMVGADGKGSGLSANAGTYVSGDTYRRASAWNVTWNFGLPRPPAVVASNDQSGTTSPVKLPDAKPVKWRNRALWRTLSRGMSKERVRAILGEPGKVSESGFNTFWYYGYPMGGQLTFDISGTLASWDEP